MVNREYPGKLLLFGEYTVLTGSRALAVPVRKWFGRLEYDEKAQRSLLELVGFLAKQGADEFLDLERLKRDVSAGMYFDSDVPQGYGLGSSAALTAAIYDGYGHKPRPELPIIRDYLARIEAHFHGSSSGLDPLVSYTNLPILAGPNHVQNVGLSGSDAQPQVFLINSGIGRFTAPLVAMFKERLKEESYRKEIVAPLTCAVETAVDEMLTGVFHAIWASLDTISRIQYDSFQEMLPYSIREDWRRTIVKPDIWLKLCGAGGGGYFMGMARPGVEISDTFDTFDIIEI